jgi:hypothetical protein
MLSFTFLDCSGGAAISGLPAFRAVRLRRDCLSTRAATSYECRPTPTQKPAAHCCGRVLGEQISLNKTPWLTGPVKWRSNLLSTGGRFCRQSRIDQSHSKTSRPGKRATRAQAGTHTPCHLVFGSIVEALC